MNELRIVHTEMNKVYEIIKGNLLSCKTISKTVEDTKFHHQISMKKVPNVLKHGLLSKRRLANLEKRELTTAEFFRFSDEYHVNGIDDISLSSMDIDFSTMHKNEFYWDPFDTIEADIIISKDVKAYRNTVNYFNEFLVSDEIHTDKFNAIDVRVLKIYTHDFHNEFKNNQKNRTLKMLEYYNDLKNIAIALKQNNLDIPLREVSDEVINLDIEKVIKLPNMKVK